MRYLLKKLTANTFVATCGRLGFKKLTTQATPPSIFENSQIDLSTLGLAPRIYVITATALSTGLKESKKSNVVTYTVN